MPAATPDFSLFARLIETVSGLGLIAGLAAISVVMVRYVVIPLWNRFDVTASARREHEKSMVLAHQGATAALERFGACLKETVNELATLQQSCRDARDSRGKNRGPDGG